MLKKKDEINLEAISKRKIYINGTLCSPVRVGKKVTYIYKGNLLQTSVVVSILETSDDYICFETKSLIYMLILTPTPVENRMCS